MAVVTKEGLAELLPEVARLMRPEHGGLTGRLDDAFSYPVGHIEGNGKRLRVSAEYNNPSKLHISCEFPKYADSFEMAGRSWTPPHGNTIPTSIGVSVDKGAEKIAKDINRRLMPGYLELLDRAKQDIAHGNEYEKKKADAVKLIMELLPDGKNPSHQRNLVYAYLDGNIRADFKVHNADSFNIEVSCDSMETVKKIIGAITGKSEGK